MMNQDGTSSPKLSQRIPNSKSGLDNYKQRARKSLNSKVLSRVFSEDYEKVKNKIVDPRGKFICRWNRIFLKACLVSLFVDPLFFYAPSVDANNMCLDGGSTLKIVLTIIRTVFDVFYFVQIIVRFNTASVAPSYRVFGRGELVIDAKRIASRYLSKGFWIDLYAALPLPQVLVWTIIPYLGGSITAKTGNVLHFIIFLQYLPRLFLILPLRSRIINATGQLTETTWLEAVYNLMLYMLASHVTGACWYLLAIGRQEYCWRTVCDQEKPSCQYDFFDCRQVQDPGRVTWYGLTNVTTLCQPSSSNTPVQWGIYGQAVTSAVAGCKFISKYLYCFWWGMQTLSCMGQNLLPVTTFIGEILFTIAVATLGLALLAMLIGNMQRYLQSLTGRLEQWRIKRRAAEHWMYHRHLRPDLIQSVRMYDQHKWVVTRGVDEEALLKDLPMDLRQRMRHHLCFDLVRRVPLFDQMDETMLDAICERLKPEVCTENIFLVREGDPVLKMFFVIRGHLDSWTTNGGRIGFFNSSRLGSGDFCGEELLTWALDPRPSTILPSSTRTIIAVSEVEAFSLRAEDLKTVASQFRRLHSKELRQKFRFYSHQWRTWAACFIQTAWRRYKKLKEEAERRSSGDSPTGSKTKLKPSKSFWDDYATRLIESTRLDANKQTAETSDAASTVQKPLHLDFSVD